MNAHQSLRNFFYLISFFIFFISSCFALDPNVEELVNYETKANRVAVRSNERVDIQHYEIPLELVGKDIASRMDKNIKDALIFNKNGVDYVRWVINPEDTLWHLEVEEFLRSKGLDSTKHTHLKGYMTASRSYIVEDLRTSAQFSIKVSTNMTGGNWRDKKQPIQDAKDIRVIADYVYNEQQVKPFEHIITMDEPGIFSIEVLDQAMVIRTLDGLVGSKKIYLPGFSAMHTRVGRQIALLNRSQNPEAFWREHYNKPLAKALAELAYRTGLTYDSPHSQNFLIELDQFLRPTGKIVIRDFGDSYLSKEYFAAKDRTDITENWTQKNVKSRYLRASVGIMHGNKFPTWLNETQYENWGKEFFQEYKKEFSRLSGVPEEKLRAPITRKHKYFKSKFKLQGTHWDNFFDAIKLETQLRATLPSFSCRNIFN